MEPIIKIENNSSLLNQEEEYVCHLLLGTNYIQVALSNPLRNHIKAVYFYSSGNKSFKTNQAEDILTSEFVQKAKKTTVGIDSLKHLLMPEPLFDPARKELYLSHQFFIEPTENIRSERIDQIHNIYTIRKGTEKLIGELMPEAEIYHSGACLLHAYPLLLSIEKENTLIVLYRKNFITLSLYTRKKLILHHTYHVENETDREYYIFNLLNTRNINFNKVLLLLHGEDEALIEFRATLKNKLEDVRFITRIKELNYIDTLYQYPSHYFFNLFSLVICAS